MANYGINSNPDVLLNAFHQLNLRQQVPSTVPPATAFASPKATNEVATLTKHNAGRQKVEDVDFSNQFSSFGQAFSAANKLGMKQFTWKGKPIAVVFADQKVQTPVNTVSANTENIGVTSVPKSSSATPFTPPTLLDTGIGVNPPNVWQQAIKEAKVNKPVSTPKAKPNLAPATTKPKAAPAHKPFILDEAIKNADWSKNMLPSHTGIANSKPNPFILSENLPTIDMGKNLAPSHTPATVNSGRKPIVLEDIIANWPKQNLPPSYTRKADYL